MKINPVKQLRSMIVEITAGGHTIKGSIWGNTELWGFSSIDPHFLKDCPSGEVHSFDEYGMSGEWICYRTYHTVIEAKVKELLSTI